MLPGKANLSSKKNIPFRNSVTYVASENAGVRTIDESRNFGRVGGDLDPTVRVNS
mgnify:CR=1 FL=1